MIRKYEKYILPKRILLVRRVPKRPQFDYNKKERLYIHIGLIGALVICIILFTAIRETKQKRTAPFIPENSLLIVDIIPETQQSSNPPPPQAPGVPVESEDIVLEETIPDIAFEASNYAFYTAPPLPTFGAGSGGGPGTGVVVSVGPRPWHETIPEYSESEIKKGHIGVIEIKLFIDEKGNVGEIEVVKNTTKSNILEEAAKKAALSSRYFPARDVYNKPMAVWTMKTYSFNAKNEKGTIK